MGSKAKGHIALSYHKAENLNLFEMSTRNRFFKTIP